MKDIESTIQQLAESPAEGCGMIMVLVVFAVATGFATLWGLNQAFAFFDVAYVIPYTWKSWAVLVTARWLWK
jgi:hypothetical protein